MTALEESEWSIEALEAEMKLTGEIITAAEINEFQRAITAAKYDPHGGKVMIPLATAERFLKLIRNS